MYINYLSYLNRHRWYILCWKFPEYFQIQKFLNNTCLFSKAFTDVIKPINNINIYVYICYNSQDHYYHVVIRFSSLFKFKFNVVTALARIRALRQCVSSWQFLYAATVSSALSATYSAMLAAKDQVEQVHKR